MLLIQYRNGLIQEGVLLAIKGNQLQIAAKDGDDVIVFRLLGEVWISESCEMVTFEFPLAPFEAIGMIPTPRNTIEQPVQKPWAFETEAPVN